MQDARGVKREEPCEARLTAMNRWDEGGRFFAHKKAGRLEKPPGVEYLRGDQG